MLGFVCRTIFRMSLNKNVLVVDPSPFDTLISDVPQKGLEGYVSKKLQIPYLSEYKGSQEELLQKRKYHGPIVGNNFRVFFSIPTALYDIPTSSASTTPRFYNVHYLFDTSSPLSTLTYEAYSRLLGKELFPPTDYTQGFDCNIGGKIVQFYPSNPDLHDKQRHKYHHVNILGMSFLSKFKRYENKGDFQKNKAVLELIE